MIESGTLLQNRYRIVKQIGQGGMGAVYFATDERFGSTVAVKQTFFDDPALRKAFEREAHLLNHLRHTALPKVSDHFTENDGQFLVMDFIEGSDISELLHQRNGAFPLADVLRWADELLDALDYLHTHEPPVVHRDIKPQNLKLTSRGQIVLLDFGLAKGTSTQTRANITAASVFGYSRNYAPLEQIQGTGTDARSDLYSLGATLYHLLTGMPPVDALTRASAIINGQPDPLRPAHLAHAQVPVAVSEILRRSMAQNAAHRQPTAADMRATLRRVASAISDGTQQGAPVNARTESATDVATVLEPMPQATYGQQSHSYTRATTHLRPPVTPKGETTIVDAHGIRRRPPMTSVVSPSHTPPARKPTAMLIGVAIAVLAACALIAFLVTRSRDVLPANSGGQNETPSGSPANAETAAPDVTRPQAASETRNSSSTFEMTTSRPQSNVARPANVSQTPTGQFANGNAEATSVSNAGTEESNRTTAPSSVSSADSSGLVIQSPAPNSQPGNNSAAAEYDAQRAEDLRRRKQQQEQQLLLQRAREQPPQYGPPPPHMGGGQRPPPRRPPPL